MQGKLSGKWFKAESQSADYEDELWLKAESSKLKIYPQITQISADSKAQSWKLKAQSMAPAQSWKLKEFG